MSNTSTLYDASYKWYYLHLLLSTCTYRFIIVASRGEELSLCQFKDKIFDTIFLFLLNAVVVLAESHSRAADRRQITGA